MSTTSNAPASLSVTTTAWESLFRAQVEVMRHIQEMPEFKELPIREYDVLFNLSRCPSGKSRLVDLNKHLLISQPSLSRMVTRLEQRGLVQRTQDPNDHRALALELTDEGRELQRRVGRAHVKALHELLGPIMGEEEFGQLARLSEKLRKGLDR